MKLLYLIVVATCASGFELVCHLDRNPYFQNDEWRFSIEDIDPSLCTMAIYWSVEADRGNSLLRFPDPNFDVQNFQKLTRLKARNPQLKTLVGVYVAAQEFRTLMSDIVQDPLRKALFVNSVVQFLETHKADGIYFEYSYWIGSCAEESQLIGDLRKAFGSRNLLIGSTGSSEDWTIEGCSQHSYWKDLDFFVVGSYALHPSSHESRLAVHASPLFPQFQGESEPAKSIDSVLKLWLRAGAPRSKIFLGVNTEGVTYRTTTNITNRGVGANGQGEAGPFTKRGGLLGYFEICSKIRDENWQAVRDPFNTTGPFVSFQDQWVSYDDPGMVAVKTNYAMKEQLGGIMIRALPYDDFRNRCGQGKYPLLSAAAKVAKSATTATVPTTTTTTPSPVTAAGILQDLGVCGRTKPGTSMRIVNGQESNVGDWPWMAALFRSATDTLPFCGGSLISDKYVLTAAHCLRSNGVTESQLVVRLGEVDFRDPARTLAMVKHSSVKFHFNPFDKEDVAIIELAAPVTFTESVGTVCLESLLPRQLEGKQTFVIGWGKTASSDSEGSETLHHTQLQVWRLPDCQRAYQGIATIKFTDLCALGSTRSGTSDSCNGDSGGPLVYEAAPGKWVLVGVVSFGPRLCGSPERPGVYKRVTSYLDWIDTVIHQR